MLVLSRRPSEKILFPSLGISVEIIQTKGNTVRVGIEAPREIRVLRAELEQHDDIEPAPRTTVSNQMDAASLNDHQRTDIGKRIDEISLAIALAQNQQRQGLEGNVEIAMKQAIERLRELKELFQPTADRNRQDAVVCESTPAYHVNRSETMLSFDGRSDETERLAFRLSFLTQGLAVVG